MGSGRVEDDSHSAEIKTLAASVSTSDGVVFVPALTGLGAPCWDPTATGLFTGITRGTTQAHMARAVLEGIAFQIGDILAAMQKDLEKPISSLNVDGGASGVKLRRPKYLEATSLGVREQSPEACTLTLDNLGAKPKPAN